MIAALIISLTAVSCSSSDSNINTAQQLRSEFAASESSQTSSQQSESVTAANDSSDIFTDRDLEQTADISGAKAISVSDDTTVDISEGGVYTVSGTAKNCTIRISTDKSEKVQLYLENVSIENEDFPAIYVVSADKVFITTADGSKNTLSVTGSFTADGDTNTDAVIYSKDDLVFNGLGDLSISSAQGNGISGKDDVKFTGGSYSIVSLKDAVEANDSISVSDGSFVIRSGKDGLHSENSDDSTVGSIFISGGTFDITASSDGIQATTEAVIDGGTFSISGSEGIEATAVTVNGGDITISASDDGINATSKSDSLTPAVEINGGSINITMGQGDTDAIDANGSIYVNGGEINITAPTSSFDYDQTAEFNGGTIIINGEEVSEIPQSMMGGGMNGGGRGGFGKGF